jgi:hypothetical protein
MPRAERLSRGGDRSAVRGATCTGSNRGLAPAANGPMWERSGLGRSAPWTQSEARAAAGGADRRQTAGAGAPGLTAAPHAHVRGLRPTANPLSSQPSPLPLGGCPDPELRRCRERYQAFEAPQLPHTRLGGWAPRSGKNRSVPPRQFACSPALVAHLTCVDVRTIISHEWPSGLRRRIRCRMSVLDCGAPVAIRRRPAARPAVPRLAGGGGRLPSAGPRTTPVKLHGCYSDSPTRAAQGEILRSRPVLGLPPSGGREEPDRASAENLGGLRRTCD